MTLRYYNCLVTLLILNQIMKLRHYQAYHEHDVVIRRTKNFQAYRRAIQLKNGMMPVYKNPVNQPSRIWQKNEDRTIQDGRFEVREGV